MIPEAKPDQIADVIRRHITFVPKPPRLPWVVSYGQALPTIAQFAQELLDDAEFRSLRLGTWLSTADGEVLTEAVGLVISPIYAPEFELAVAGLKLAAELQHREGQGAAGRAALIIVGASLVFGGLAIITREAA